MHPTGPEQLRGVRRALATVAADEALAAEHREVLVDAARVLERLEASWPARLGFLLADNRATEALLAELGAEVPPEAATATSVQAAPGDDLGPESPDEVAHARNKALRGALADLVAALPPSPAGDGARRAIAAHLRRRLAADPSLHRRPRPYGTEPAPEPHQPDGAP